MPAPSYTYTLTNGSTADASQVMQNFNDVLNGITDGTKNLSISALTAGGTATLNGAVILGSASDDDLTFNGSLASSIPVKTTASYDFGSATLGLRSVYIGNASTYTVRLLGSASQTGTYTLTLPVAAPAASGYIMSFTSAGVGSFVLPLQDAPVSANNYTLTATVGSSALTVALKTKAGTDPSSTDPVTLAFRSATAATGDYTMVTATAATSVVVSSGSTLGHSSAVATPIYVYAVNNGGTIELAVSTKRFDDGTVQSTTAEGGAGAADSATVMYSTTARTDKPIRLLARLTSNQVTAGTWAAVPTEIALGQKFITDPMVGVASGLSVPNGYVGEYQSQYSAGSIAIMDATANIASQSLTAGDWDVWGYVDADSTGATSSTEVWIQTSISLTSATIEAPIHQIYLKGFGVSGSARQISPIRRVSVSATTTVYLVARTVVIAAGSMSALTANTNSGIFARRRC